MRLPNGYGTVYKLQGNRRRPYVVKKTIDGRQRALGYFESYQEAFEYLVEINHCTPTHQVTFSAVYAAWSQRHFPDVSLSSRQAVHTAGNARPKRSCAIHTRRWTGAGCCGVRFDQRHP